MVWTRVVNARQDSSAARYISVRRVTAHSPFMRWDGVCPEVMSITKHGDVIVTLSLPVQLPSPVWTLI
jgi:hypothetical protein